MIVARMIGYPYAMKFSVSKDKLLEGLSTFLPFKMWLAPAQHSRSYPMCCCKLATGKFG
jgi:hypothetical protein